VAVFLYNQISATTPPHLPPQKFWLFQNFKTGLKSHCFASVDEIQSKCSTHRENKRNVTPSLKAIPKKALPKCFQQWQDHWSKCVGAEEQLFEYD
jgi:hypothetical protein